MKHCYTCTSQKIILIWIFIILLLSGISPSLIHIENFVENEIFCNSIEQINTEEFLKTDQGNFINSIDNNLFSKERTASSKNINSDIIIEDISASFNKIIITIRNIGLHNISNISIDFNTSGGIFIITSKNIRLPNLQAGDNYRQEIMVFGLGTGTFKKYIKFIFTINSPDTISIFGGATVKIFGPLVRIISTSYNIDEIFEGYTLFAPMWDSKSYLIDNGGDVVHSWNSIHLETQAAYLLENGNLIRTAIVPFSPIFSGGSQGFIEMFDWTGNRIWKYKYSSDEYCQHHDVEVLPNGNILLIAWETKTSEEAIDAGKNPDDIYANKIWTDHIIEIEPMGESDANVVWEWHAWDHLIQDYDSSKNNFGIVSDHPELIDINYGRDWRDWLHVNSIDYNEKFDQILVSVFNFNEVWVIDHSTTIEEASDHTGGNTGKGGDLLYRWGNPQAYDHGNDSNQKYFGQHGANWVETGCPGEGNILVFNNGGGRPEGKYSSIDEIVPPVDDTGNYYYSPGDAYSPIKQIWIYTSENPLDMRSSICSNAQRLSNGNTLICSATQGTIFEVTPEKDIVWSYYNTYPNWCYIKTVSEALRYPPDYPGLNNLI